MSDAERYDVCGCLAAIGVGLVVGVLLVIGGMR